MDTTAAGYIKSRPTQSDIDYLRRATEELQSRGTEFKSLLLEDLGGMVQPSHPLHPARSGTAAFELLSEALGVLVNGPDADTVELLWQRLGYLYGEHHIPADGFAVAARALVHVARKMAGNDRSAADSSTWAGLNFWMVTHLSTGASLADQSNSRSAPADQNTSDWLFPAPTLPSTREPGASETAGQTATAGTRADSERPVERPVERGVERGDRKQAERQKKVASRMAKAWAANGGDQAIALGSVPPSVQEMLKRRTH